MKCVIENKGLKSPLILTILYLAILNSISSFFPIFPYSVKLSAVEQSSKDFTTRSSAK